MSLPPSPPQRRVFPPRQALSGPFTAQTPPSSLGTASCAPDTISFHLTFCLTCLILPTMIMSSAMTAKQFRQMRLDMFEYQKDAARAIGVTAETLSRWENGRRTIPLYVVELLSAWHAAGRQRV